MGNLVVISIGLLEPPYDLAHKLEEINKGLGPTKPPSHILSLNLRVQMRKCAQEERDLYIRGIGDMKALQHGTTKTIRE